MVTAVYPGSFDPVHNGHLDVIDRARPLFDRLIVGVLVNPAKQGLFDTSERIELIQQATSAFPGVEVQSFSGLAVNFCRSIDAKVIVKGLRAVTDFDYEMPMAQMNQFLGVDTVFIITSPAHSYVRSSLLKEVVHNGGSIDGLTPALVAERLTERLSAADLKE